MSSALRQSQVQISIDEKNVEWTISHPVLFPVTRLSSLEVARVIIFLDIAPEMLYGGECWLSIILPFYANGSWLCTLHLSFPPTRHLFYLCQSERWEWYFAVVFICILLTVSETKHGFLSKSHVSFLSCELCFCMFCPFFKKLTLLLISRSSLLGKGAVCELCCNYFPSFSFTFLKKFYLFIWLRRVLVVACGI